jgi:hypothetical protein
MFIGRSGFVLPVRGGRPLRLPAVKRGGDAVFVVRIRRRHGVYTVRQAACEEH